jgi:hypothetical protein
VLGSFGSCGFKILPKPLVRSPIDDRSRVMAMIAANRIRTVRIIAVTAISS